MSNGEATPWLGRALSLATLIGALASAPAAAEQTAGHDIVPAPAPRAQVGPISPTPTARPEGLAALALKSSKTSPTPLPRPATFTQAASVTGGFEAWRAAFRTRALQDGIRAEVFDSAFRGVSPSAQVLKLDRRQPEFTRPLWEYLDQAVSDTRVANGRDKATAHAALLAELETRYGVPTGIILAIWGVESNYGSNYGDIPVIQALATLAHDGRRRDFGEQQLLAALRILQAGDITPARMVGSWAGAMGHTQFIPTSYLDFAVDHGGDGRRDIWDPNPADALASAANYLARAGWQAGAPIVVEIRLPQDFDYLLAADGVRRSAAQWQAAGIAQIDGSPLPAGEGVEILVPAGAKGPAFAAYRNFRVIKRYNNATSYALAVAHLGDRIAGAPRFVAGWPRDDRPLSRSEKQELQRRLSALGFDTQGVDGIIGPNSRAAVRRFQKSQGLVPDGYVSAGLLSLVRQNSGS